MTNLEWLLNGDPVVVHLVKKYLLDEDSCTYNRGFIQKYLNLIDPKTLKWGNGFYGPKWISTHYTLLDLKYMEIMPDTKIYHESLLNYIDHYWDKYILRFGIQSMDLCISGMMVGFLTYGKIQDRRIDQMIDYILGFPMQDGGWNCLWNHKSKPQISSVHTTINVLEGLSEYLTQAYTYRIEEVRGAINRGIKVLLDRQLYRVKNTETPIHPSISQHHFPPRWKYDYLRILEFLAKQGYPLCDEMKPALDLLESRMNKGKLTKGTTISGLIHFPLEMEPYGRFNTLRAYIVLKYYRPNIYDKWIHQEVLC